MYGQFIEEFGALMIGHPTAWKIPRQGLKYIANENTANKSYLMPTTPKSKTL